MLRTFSDIFWPTIKPLSDADRTSDLNLQTKDIKTIENSSWSDQSVVALEEARRIAASEDERTKTADSKASNFLLVVAALIPLLTYLETAIWDTKLGNAPKWLTLSILIVAVAYLSGTAYWALKAVSVRGFHRNDSTDLASIWSHKSGKVEIAIKNILVAARKNQDLINDKITAVKMAHSFLLHAIFAFCALLFVQAAWEIWHTYDASHSVPKILQINYGINE